MAEDLPQEVLFRRVHCTEVPQLNIAPYLSNKIQPRDLRITLDHVSDRIKYLKALRTRDHHDDLQPLHEESYIQERRFEIIGLPVVKAYTMHPEEETEDRKQRECVWVPREPLVIDGWELTVHAKRNGESVTSYSNTMDRVFPDEKFFRGKFSYQISMTNPAHWRNAAVPEEVYVHLSYRIDGADDKTRTNGPKVPLEELSLSATVSLNGDGSKNYWTNLNLEASRELRMWAGQPERTIRVKTEKASHFHNNWKAEIIGLETTTGDLECVLGVISGQPYTSRTSHRISQGEIGAAMLIPGYNGNSVDTQATVANIVRAFKKDTPEEARQALIGFKAIAFK
jgi:hypothetical protein